MTWFSLVPGVGAPGGVHIWDKFSHFAAYAVLAVLLIRALQLRRQIDARQLFAAWLMCVAYGLLLEGLQGWMALGRQFEARDLFANALGSLVGCVVFCRSAVRASRL